MIAMSVKVKLFCMFLITVTLLLAYLIYVEWRCFLNTISISPNLIKL
jgi:hypothetical protein